MRNAGSTDSSMHQLQQQFEKMQISEKQVDEAHNEGIVVVARPAHLLKCKSWDSLPWPACKRIFFFLHTYEDCIDLANLSKVSTQFHSGVKEFMCKDENRLKFNQVSMEKNDDGLEVSIHFFPSNLPYHDLASLDWPRYEKLKRDSDPILRVTLSGDEDPIVDEVFRLLSSLIESVVVGAFASELFSPEDFALCARLLSASTVDDIDSECAILDDSRAPSIISICSHAGRINMSLDREDDAEGLSNPTAFITQLYALPPTSVCLLDHSFLFFGLPNSYWKKFLDEKLASNSMYSVMTGSMGMRLVREAPIALPQSPIRWIEWVRVREN
ncbi:hypothetical protein PMAYCL1PPCAC_28230 [Pristionchus mayeri]|uniref:F-box domain-containing protein n=1 Tax=Pristionchus mayeri TaxID=1317129 RepID=A0AAN5IBG3_9BILA|nr:hypothetical protein PMAYCL1PPCAC_28230 [Pristionchus mayeri]